MATGSKFPAWIRHSGVGLELAGAAAGLALAGYWVDGRFGTRPWGMLVGVFIGIVGGLYNLVRESMVASREAQQEDAGSATANGGREPAVDDRKGK